MQDNTSDSQENVERQDAGRRVNIFTESFLVDEQQEKIVIPKSESSLVLLVQALKAHYLFSHLTETELLDIVHAMPQVQSIVGDLIIHQGDSGDLFFVLESGKCDIIVNDIKVGEYEDGACFGELALLYSSPRAATIRATTDCTLWSIDIRTFRGILGGSAMSGLLERSEFLKRVPLLKNLRSEQVGKIAAALDSADFTDGAYIIRQGDIGTTFYIIQSGTVRCTQTRNDGLTESFLLDLHEGDFFGEMALMLEEPRHANCIAKGPVKCLSLEKSQFDELLGPLQQILASQMRIRILKSVPILSTLSDRELDRIANVMRAQLFNDGDIIIREGQPGSRFYIVNDGEVKCVKNDNGNEIELIRLTNQEFFGERALLHNEPRTATVIAVGRVECLVLERSDFERLLGNVYNEMEEEHKRRESAAPMYVPSNKPKLEQIPFDDLRLLRTIGTGTFGRVRLVQQKSTGRVCALKCMTKTQIVASHQQLNIMNEKNILLACQHPFVLELIQTYNTPDQLMLLVELIQGGELWTYIYAKPQFIPRTKSPGGFFDPAAMFYASCVISAFESIHGMGVAYRDLKPENLLVDDRGYLKMIDFGFAKYIPYEKNGSVQTKSFTLCGTPEYLSPELILSKGHDKSVDCWALGCFIYELIVGHTPFQHDQQSEIFKRIIHSERALFIPRAVNLSAGDLIRQLLRPNPSFRLGSLSGGISDIMNHQWFQEVSFDWQALYRKEIPSPFQPQIRDPLDVSNFEAYAEQNNIPKYNGPQDVFEGF